jgi:hypothetical protein
MKIIKSAAGWKREKNIPAWQLWAEDILLAAENFCVNKDPQLLLNILEVLNPPKMYEYHKLDKIYNDIQDILYHEKDFKNGGVDFELLNYRKELIEFVRIWVQITGVVTQKHEGLDAGWSHAFLFQDMANKLGRIIEYYKPYIPSYV